MTTAACAPRGPVVGTAAPVVGAGGTIAGVVRDAGKSPLSGRRVTAIDQASGAKFEASTGVNGGYTVKVPAGTYRLEVELRAGEVAQTQPAPTEVNVGDLDPDRDFVVTLK